MIKTTEISRLELLPEGIVEQTYKEGATIDVEEAKRVIELVEEMLEGAPLFLLNDLRSKTVFTREARAYFTENSKDAMASAFIINSKIGEVAVNFFLRFNSPNYDLRIFNDREEGYSWLLEKIAAAGQ